MKKLQKNTLASFVHQIATIICGFILPRFILQGYGSEVNGLVNSITGFLSVISLLELGMGAVVKSALYKPLADKDNGKIGEIITSAEKFFRKVAFVLAIYIVVLMWLYPIVVDQSYDFMYTAVLILAIGISNFMQYYFGMSNRLLLIADQRGYIQDNVQSITLVLNTCISVLLILSGASIHVVKLVASLIYICRPMFLRVYVDKKYSINRKSIYQDEPIKQKWNGVAQHLAAFTISGTDTVVLSLFGTLADVSIYAVYSIVVKGIMQLLTSVTTGISSMMGELWAKKETDRVKEYFSWIEWGFHTVSVFVWGCTLILIMPFVQVYTLGVHDVNYIVPMFALFITLAHFMETLRIPYNMMVLVAGHYKQTQKYYVVVALLNIFISVLTVGEFGVVGVAVGTFVAMTYHTIWTAIYNSKNFVKGSVRSFVKQSIVDLLSLLLIVYCAQNIMMQQITYLSWFVMAIKVVVVVFIVQIIINIVFYREKVLSLARILWKR